MQTNLSILDKQIIKNETHEILQIYRNEMGWKNLDDIIIDVDLIYEIAVYPENETNLKKGIDLGYLENEKILGKTIPSQNLILIDKVLDKFDPRYPFTMAHEIGHSVLDREDKKNKFFKCNNYENILDINDYKEKRANFFAQNLIMPDFLVKYKFAKFYNKMNLVYESGQRYYWFNYNGVIIREYIGTFTDYVRTLAKPLTKYFSNISVESLSYTIVNLGIVENMTDEKILKINANQYKNYKS